MKRTPLKRRKPLNPVSAKKRAAAPERGAVREAVFERDGYRCRIGPLVPDVPCAGRLSPHHLRKASAGGKFDLDNLWTACIRHNDWVEDHPAQAGTLGLVIK